jgi:hypothetical protein
MMCRVQLTGKATLTKKFDTATASTLPACAKKRAAVASFASVTAQNCAICEALAQRKRKEAVVEVKPARQSRPAPRKGALCLAPRPAALDTLDLTGGSS